MAVEQPLFSYTLPAGGDLSTWQFRAVVIDSNGRAAPAGAAAQIAGILQNKPNAVGVAATISAGGISKVVAGGTFAAGAQLTTNASGQAVVAATGNRIFGQALEAGVSGRIVSVLLFSNGRLA